MAPLTIKDRLLIKALRIERASAVDRMIVEFPPRRWKVGLAWTLFISQICLK